MVSLFSIQICKDFKKQHLSSLKLAHVFRSKIDWDSFLIGKKGRYLTTCAFVLWDKECLKVILKSRTFSPWSFEEEGYKQNIGNHASLGRRLISYRNILEKGKISYRYSYLKPDIPRKSLISSYVYDLKEDIKYLWRILNL